MQVSPPLSQLDSITSNNQLNFLHDDFHRLIIQISSPERIKYNVGKNINKLEVKFIVIERLGEMSRN
jgi:hypothetical protein